MGRWSNALAVWPARGRRGDRFSLEKHPQGTEVKAVTYSNMQITHTAAAGGAGGARGEAGGAGGEWNIYVIVDI